MDCNALSEEADSDLVKAETILRTKGIRARSKKASRVTKEGIVASYIHLQGKVGVLVEVNCETDFVAKNENFRGFRQKTSRSISRGAPALCESEDVPGKLIEAEREIYKAQVKGKPANVTEKIVDGKLDKFTAQSVCSQQGFIKNPDVTIKDLLNGKIAEPARTL